MNVLILTPDRVGSTLLQRLITVYMVLRGFDRPVINLHELTNGLMAYHSDVFGQEVLTKPPGEWGYYQTLPEIQDLLTRCDHYKTSRLAHYHLQRREDSQQHRLAFYQYLNDNFYIIAARRGNLFEHALSWCIYTQSRRLNVYSAQEKVEVFADLCRSGITVNRENLVKYLDAYRDYISWSQRHFDISCYFDYERDIHDIERFILDLPMFRNSTGITWQSQFGMSWQDWNRCHYLVSDVDQLPAPVQISHDSSHNHAIVSQIYQGLSVQDRAFVSQQGAAYVKAHRNIQELVDHKILVTHIPIKLQTLRQKRAMTHNWSECVTWYNQWVDQHQFGNRFQDRADAMDQELLHYRALTDDPDTV